VHRASVGWAIAGIAVWGCWLAGTRATGFAAAAQPGTADAQQSESPTPPPIRSLGPPVADPSIRAQQPPEPSTAIQANVHLVLIPVTVSGKKGGFVDGLKLEDFVLTDEGVRQNIRLDTSDTVQAPVALVVAVEANGISSPEIAKIHRVGGMFQPLIAGEKGQVAVIAYDSEIRTFEDFTSDSSKVGAAIEAIDARTIKTARLIDAVGEAVRMLSTKPTNYRRELVIIGESRDRGSKTKLSAAAEMAQRAGVTVYFATYSVQGSVWTAKPEDNPTMPVSEMDLGGAIAEVGRMGKKNAADVLATATGGRRLPFLTLSALEKELTRAGEEIHSQYLLSFVPASDRSGFHRVEVTVPTRPDAVVRARPGYWAEK